MNEHRLHIILSTLVLFLLFVSSAYGQLSWIERIVEEDYVGAEVIKPYDFDGDGDMDLLGSASNDYDINWWENDGAGNFTCTTVDQNYVGVRSPVAADLDNDGDTDVVACSYAYDRIDWWENDGQGEFIQHEITDDFNYARTVDAADLDDDGDIDILGAAYLDREISWWENNGAGAFTYHIIRTDLGGADYVEAIDLDEDGYTDVLGSSDNEILWWQNDGSENFTEHTLVSGYTDLNSIHTADLDQDGDIDLLGAEASPASIFWWENDGQQGFTPHMIIEGYFGTSYAADIDGDRDADIVTSSNTTDFLGWLENDGAQNFVLHTIANPNGARSGCAADLDQDGDMDVLATACYENIVYWWEQEGIPGTIEITLYPEGMPITIPAGGGTISFHAEVDNNGISSSLQEVWCDVELPSGSQVTLLGPAQYNFNPGLTSSHTITLDVPPGAPAGDYLFHAFLGDYPYHVVNADFFTFTKENGEEDLLESCEWNTTGSLFEKAADTVEQTDDRQSSVCVNPNPFNPTTVLSYALQDASFVHLTIYDISGRQVAHLVHSRQDAGVHEVTFDGTGLASGIYIYRFTMHQTGAGASPTMVSGKLVLMK